MKWLSLLMSTTVILGLKFFKRFDEQKKKVLQKVLQCYSEMLIQFSGYKRRVFPAFLAFSFIGVPLPCIHHGADFGGVYGLAV